MCLLSAVPKQAPQSSGGCQRSAIGLDSSSLLPIIAGSRHRFDWGSIDPTPIPGGNDAPGTATDRTVAVPSPRATTTAAPSQGDDDNQTDNDDAPTPEPAAEPGPQPEDIGDPFLPNLPNDNTRGPQAAEERPVLRKEPGADGPGFEPGPADKLLDTVYGDWPHANDGRHLDGGVEGDATWQRRWRRIVDLPTTHYSVPKGKVGRRFLAKLASEFRGIRACTWNS
jgi:hypothetical protein